MRTVLLVTFVFVAVLVAPAPALATPSCGAVVTSSVSLQRNLNCHGTALYIGADNVTIDLSGHTISGDGTGDGIDVGELPLPCALNWVAVTNVAVENGRIHGFDVGIRIQPFSTYIGIHGVDIAHNVTGGIYGKNPCGFPQHNDYLSISDNWIHDNVGVGSETGARESSNAPSQYTVVSGNEVDRNGGTGIQLDQYSDYSTVHNNYVHNNGGDGIKTDVSITSITNNVVKANGGSGIDSETYFFPHLSLIANNRAVANGAYGIYALSSGAPGDEIVDGGGNVANHNVLTQCVEIVCA